jgi:hypothetical protein
MIEEELAPLKASYLKNPILGSLIGFDINHAKQVCFLEFVGNTYKVFYDGKKYLLYYYVSREKGHQYKHATSFSSVFEILEPILVDTVLSCIVDCYEKGWWSDIPVWLLTDPINIENEYRMFFHSILIEKEKVLNEKMPPHYGEGELLVKWNKFLSQNEKNHDNY